MHRFGRLARLVAVLLTVAVVGTSAGCSPSAKEAASPASAPNAPDKEVMMLALSSPAFEGGGLIPVEYANSGVSGGQNVSIPYEWSGAPDGTKSLALVLVDLHPVAHSWVHWMVTAIPAEATSLARGASGEGMPAGSIEHPNTSGRVGYGGPQPPPGTGNHEYEATLYALDVASPNPNARTLSEFNAALSGHVLGSASYSGLFGR